MRFMKRSVYSVFLVFTLLMAFNAKAQYYTEDDKKEGKLKMITFSKDEPGFNNTTVPDKWKSESAVILYQKYEYTFLHKFKNIEFEETYRRRIKMNDKAAVEDFSKFYWNLPEKQTGNSTLFADNSNKFYIQVSIIKPNGTVVDVNIKDAVDVNASETKNMSKFWRRNYTKGSKKLAIPNLEPGDIIDYFYFKRMYYAENFYADFGESTLALGEVYPIYAQKYAFVLEDDFCIKMNTINGAPKITSKADKNKYGAENTTEKVMIYSVEDKEREKFADEPWSYELVNNPLLRFNVIYPIHGYRDGKLQGEKGVLKEKFSSEEIIENYQKKFSEDFSWASSLSSDPLEHVKTVMPKEKDVKKICDELYYAVRFYNLSNSKELLSDGSLVVAGPFSTGNTSVDMKKYYESFGKETDNLRARNKRMTQALEKKTYNFNVNGELQFLDLNTSSALYSYYFKSNTGGLGYYRATFAKCLEKLKIPYKVLLVPERKYGKIEDVLFADQYTPVIMVEDGGKQYFYYGFGRHVTPDITDYGLEGSEAIVYNPATFKKDKKVERIKIPVSSADFNKITTKTTLPFDPAKYESIVFKREIAVHGDYKYDYDYLNFINDSCDFQDMRYYIKDFDKKFKPKEVKNFKAKEEEMKKMLPEYYALKNKVVKGCYEKALEEDYKVDKVDTIILLNNGRVSAKGDVLFKDQIHVREMATKLGSNFSISIGKVIGDQAIIEAKDMKNRKTDVNFAFARTIENEITFEIPMGYKAEGIKDLNSSIDNDACSFISTAEQVGNSIVIKTKKVYKHNMEKKENWQKITDMITAAYNFSQKKIILKKV